MPHTVPNFERFVRLGATLKVAEEHAAKRVVDVTATLVAKIGASEPATAKVWLADVRLQEGKPFSDWEPNLSELLVRHGQQKVVVQQVVPLSRFDGAESATNTGVDPWTNPENATGLRDAVVATRASRVAGSVSAPLRLEFPDVPASVKQQYTITQVRLLFSTRQTGTQLGNGNLEHNYDLGGATLLESFTGDVDFIANAARAYDITAAIAGDWANIDALRAQVLVSYGPAAQTITASCDAVELEVTAEKTIDVVELQGTPDPRRFFNVVGRGHQTVVLPNFGGIAAPVETRMVVRGDTAGLWTRPGTVPAAGRPHVRTLPRFEFFVLGDPDDPGSDIRTFDLAHSPVSEAQWLAKLIFRNPGHTQQATPDRSRWHVQNDLEGGPSQLVVDSIPPFVDSTWEAHLDYLQTPLWVPDQVLGVSTPDRTSRQLPAIRSYSTVEPGNFAGTMTIPAPAAVPDVDTALVAFISGRQGAAGAPSSITHPAGWTVLHEVQSGSGDGHVTGLVAYKLDSGSEPADYTWTFNGASLRGVGGIVRVSGADLEALIAASSAATGTSGDAAASTIAVPEGSLLLFLGGSSNADTVAAPAEMLSRWGLLNQFNSTTRHFHRAAFERAAGGATGARTATHNGARWCAFLVAIEPAPVQRPTLGEAEPEGVRSGGWPMVAGGPYVALDALYSAGTPLLAGQPIKQGSDERLALGADERWSALVEFEEWDLDHPPF